MTNQILELFHTTHNSLIEEYHEEFCDILESTEKKYRFFNQDIMSGSLHNMEVFLIYIVARETHPPCILESGAGKGRTTALLAEIALRADIPIYAVSYPEVDPDVSEIADRTPKFESFKGSSDEVVDALGDKIKNGLVVIDGPKPAVANQSLPFRNLFRKVMTDYEASSIFVHDCRRKRKSANFLAVVRQWVANDPEHYMMFEVPSLFMTEWHRKHPSKTNPTKTSEGGLHIESLYQDGVSNLSVLLRM